MVIRKMLPRRGAHKRGHGGRGRRAGRIQPEVQPVAQATNLAALVTHANLAIMKVQGLDYADAGTAAACPSSSCSGSSRTL